MQTNTHMHDVRVVAGAVRCAAPSHALPCPATPPARRSRCAQPRVERECPGSAKHRHLDLVIPKPWGEEYRVYDDVLLDAWLLELGAGRRTSEHCHARKETELLCLRGHGEVTGGDGRSRAIAPGAVVRIEQGAVHRTTAITALTLVEIETPRDKLDVVRLLDENGRAGRGYELALARRSPACGARGRRRRATARAAAPALARRARCASASSRLPTSPRARRDLVFAIGLDSESVLRRRLRIAGPRDRDLVADRLHLTIRTNHREKTT